MPYGKISCRIAIQICVGRLPSGRKSHRTFSLKDVRPDVSWEAIVRIIRALAPLLEFPITKVTKVTKREMFFDVEELDALDAVPCSALPEPRVVTEHPAAHRAIAYHFAKSSPCASLRQKGFMPGRAPPERKKQYPSILVPHRL